MRRAPDRFDASVDELIVLIGTNAGHPCHTDHFSALAGTRQGEQPSVPALCLLPGMDFRQGIFGILVQRGIGLQEQFALPGT